MATPILAAAAPAFGGHPAIEWGAFTISAAIAAPTLRLPAMRRQPSAITTAVAGFLTWLLALTLVSHGAAHTPLLVAGSLTVAVSMFMAIRQNHRAADECGCHACATEADDVAPGSRAAIG